MSTTPPSLCEIVLQRVTTRTGRRVRELAVETVTALAQELLDGGAPGIHLCTLNFSTAAKEIWANLGLR